MFLVCVRKPEYLEETHSGTTRTYNLRTQRPQTAGSLQCRTFLLIVVSAKPLHHCATLPSSSLSSTRGHFWLQKTRDGDGHNADVILKIILDNHQKRWSSRKSCHWSQVIPSSSPGTVRREDLRKLSDSRRLRHRGDLLLCRRTAWSQGTQPERPQLGRSKGRKRLIDFLLFYWSLSKHNS